MSKAPASRDTPSTLRPSGFQGQIKGTTLPDVVQMECLSGGRRVVRVSSGSNTGYLFFRDGSLVHASTRLLTGEPAALEMLAWNEGTFEPIEREWPSRDSITCGWQTLLLRAAQIHDEKRASRVVALHEDARPSGDVRSNVGETMELKATPIEVGGHVFRAEDLEFVLRLGPAGNIVLNHGGSQDFADIVAYVCRLTDLIGGQLGIEPFVGMECVLKSGRCFVIAGRSGEVVALKPRPSADSASIRELFGI